MKSLISVIVLMLCIYSFEASSNGRLPVRGVAKVKNGVLSMVNKMKGIPGKGATAFFTGVAIVATCMNFLACDVNDYPHYRDIVGVEDVDSLGIMASEIPYYNNMPEVWDYNEKLILYEQNRNLATGVASVSFNNGEPNIIIKGEGDHRAVIEQQKVQGVMVSDSEHTGRFIAVLVKDARIKWSALPSEVVAAQKILDHNKSFYIHGQVSEAYSDDSLLFTPNYVIGPGKWLKKGGWPGKNNTILKVTSTVGGEPIYLIAKVNKVEFVEIEDNQ